jgi:quercetin dioxygenase-like cupin family protein
MLSILLTGTLVAQEAKVTPLLSKDLTGIPGKEGVMITVDYAPGATDAIHRHNAHVFVYVLEGSVVMQVRGGKEVTLVPGQTFYEGPQDGHVVGRNASKSKSAKFLLLEVI